MAEIEFHRLLWGWNLKTRKRQPLKLPADETGKIRNAKLEDIAVEALLTQARGETHPQGKKSFRRFKLAEKIIEANGDAVELRAEEVTLIKERIGKIYGPRVTGPAHELLERQDYDPLVDWKEEDKEEEEEEEEVVSSFEEFVGT